jgi:adenine deaminase
LSFFSATHLPYIRITPRGIFDVMKKTVLFPTIMR